VTTFVTTLAHWPSASDQFRAVRERPGAWTSLFPAGAVSPGARLLLYTAEHMVVGAGGNGLRRWSPTLFTSLPQVQTTLTAQEQNCAAELANPIQNYRSDQTCIAKSAATRESNAASHARG
jgi:hypothetical protein